MAGTWCVVPCQLILPQKCDSLCYEYTFIWESSRNYKIFQVSSQICLWLIQILLVWMPAWYLSQAIHFSPMLSRQWHSLLSGTVALWQISAPPCLLLGLCSLFSLASLAFGKDGFFLLLRAWAVHGWVQKAPLLTLGCCLTCCWMENCTAFPSFPGQVTACVHGRESKELKWPLLLSPAIRKLRLSCPRAQSRAVPGLCLPMWAVMVPREGWGLGNSLLREGPTRASAWQGSELHSSLSPEQQATPFQGLWNP